MSDEITDSRNRLMIIGKEASKEIEPAFSENINTVIAFPETEKLSVSGRVAIAFTLFAVLLAVWLIIVMSIKDKKKLKSFIREISNRKGLDIFQVSSPFFIGE